jgi:hypothetical protein
MVATKQDPIGDRVNVLLESAIELIECLDQVRHLLVRVRWRWRYTTG